jgi:hypothetical protein
VPYSADNDTGLHIDRNIKALNDKLRICRDVREMMKTDGWKNTVEPLVDRLIVDVVGGKLAGKWVAGRVDRARTDERREFYVGYKQSLIDFYNRVVFHDSQVELLEEKINDLVKAKDQKFTDPMEGTKYAVAGW